MSQPLTTSTSQPLIADDTTATDDTKYKNIGWKELNKWKFYSFMPATSITTHLIYYPAIVVKIRIQTASATGFKNYLSTRDAFRTIYRTEGVRGFYKGWSIAALNLLSGPLYMTTYEVLREKIGEGAKKFIASESTCSFLGSSIGASTAIILTTCLATPLDMISQKLMIQRQQEGAPNFVPKTPKQIGQEIYAKEKIRGFYRAFWPTIVNRLPTGALIWGTYPVYNLNLRNLIDEYIWPKNWNGTNRQIKDLGVIPAIAGIAAGATGALITFPLDLVRARIQLQSQKKSFYVTGKEVVNQFGVKGLYTGVYARILHCGIMYGLIFPTYEVVKLVSSN